MAINGDGGNNTLTGNVFVNTINGFGGNDTIDGRNGADALNGGSGNDTFVYTSTGHLDAGETVNGGTGLDKLRLDDSGVFNFRAANISSIEEVEYGGNDGTYAQFYSSQVGSGLSSTATIDGWSGAGINDYLDFYMNTTSLNLSNLVFQDWVEADDQVYIFGSGAAESITGSDVDDSINGNAGNDTIDGHTGDDYIHGGSGNDTITGGAGEDNLEGGAGNDTFRYTSASHLVSGEIINGGGDSDKLLLSAADDYDFRDAILTSIEEVEFDGGDGTTARFNSSQIGSGLSATAVIDGYSNAGINDYLRVHMDTANVNLSNMVFQDWTEADDHVSIYGTSAANSITGSDVDDNIFGNDGNDVINGHTGDDYIEGASGNDIIRGGAGKDSLYGNSGNDTFRYFASSELVDGEIISGGTGTDKIEIRAIGTYDFRDTAMTGIEEIEFTTSSDVSVFLESSDIGGTGLNSTATIDGNSSAGANNYLSVYMNTGSVNLSGLNFQDWVEADDQVVIHGRGAANDSITGSDQDDTVYGNGGNDTIRGHQGKDTLYGGIGNDYFRYYAINEMETGEAIYGGAGIDEIEIRGAGVYNFAVGILNSIEEIRFVSTDDNTAIINSSQLGAGLSATGTIDSNNTPGAENEFRVNANTATTDLTGLTFQDWVEADDDVVVVGNNAAQTVLGSSVGDVMYAYGGDDVLRGFKGDDTLIGGAGNDALYGGNGNDTVSASSGTNTLAGGKGNDTVQGGSGADTIFGNIGADWLYGNSGNDVISGGGWVDRVFGGSGDDTIHGNYGNDQLYGEAGDDTITGGYGLDVIHGGAGHDQIYGGGFTDQLYGNSGDDSIWNGGGNDTAYGGDGYDVIYGEGGNDTIYGNAGDDDLYGGAGSDILAGGTGADWMWGGDGVTDDGTLDRFVFASSIGHDRIHDFENGIDRIDFSGNATFNNFATVSANAAQSGSDVVITQNASNTLRIDDMNLADLDASDFIF